MPQYRQPLSLIPEHLSFWSHYRRVTMATSTEVRHHNIEPSAVDVAPEACITRRIALVEIAP